MSNVVSIEIKACTSPSKPTTTPSSKVNVTTFHPLTVNCAHVIVPEDLRSDKEVQRGNVRISMLPGNGAQFRFAGPLTLSDLLIMSDSNTAKYVAHLSMDGETYEPMSDEAHAVIVGF
jgi:hypothetical protein